jgi:hypothetical protein
LNPESRYWFARISNILEIPGSILSHCPEMTARSHSEFAWSTRTKQLFHVG